MIYSSNRYFDKFISYIRCVADAPATIWLAVLTAFAMALPTLVNGMPPILDYPNHLVRFWLLAGGAAHPPLSRVFAPDWGHSATNIATDVFATLADLILPADITGRLVLTLAALLPVAGMVLLSRKLFGQWSYWHIWMGLAAWPLVLLTGFMSLELAFGVALIAIWCDLVLLRSKPVPAVARQIGLCLVVILFHPFGLLFYLVVTAGLAVGTTGFDIRDRSACFEAAKRLFWAWLPPVVALLLTGLRMLFGRGEDDAGGGLPMPVWDEPPWQDLPGHVFHALTGALRSYNTGVDLVFVALLCLPVVVALVFKTIRAHIGLSIAAILLFLISIVAPQGIGSTSMVDIRLWSMTLLLAPIAVLPVMPLGRRATMALYILALTVIGARSLWLTTVWHDRQSDMQSLYRALDSLPPGARLLPAMVADDGDAEPTGRFLADLTPTYAHLPTLAVLRRHAYVPTVFAQAGKQPLRVLPPFDETHEVSGGLPATVSDLKTHNTAVDGFLEHWEDDFDYVLLLNADITPKATIDGACLVTDQGFARLYRIAKPASPCT